MLYSRVIKYVYSSDVRVCKSSTGRTTPKERKDDQRFLSAHPLFLDQNINKQGIEFSSKNFIVLRILPRKRIMKILRNVAPSAENMEKQRRGFDVVIVRSGPTRSAMGLRERKHIFVIIVIEKFQ